MKLVEIVWLDAGSKNGWFKPEEVANWAHDDLNFTVTTVGYMFGQNPDSICLVMGDSEDHYMNPVRIQKSSIIQERELNYGQKAKPDETDKQ